MASYIHGTGAEKLAPSEREERLQRKRRQDVGRSVKRQHRIRRNQERAMYMDLPYVIMLTLASICTLYLCVNYLHLQSAITARMHNIEAMEEKLEKMRTENDALETRHPGTLKTVLIIKKKIYFDEGHSLNTCRKSWRSRSY